MIISTILSSVVRLASVFYKVQYLCSCLNSTLLSDVKCAVWMLVCHYSVLLDLVIQSQNYFHCKIITCLIWKTIISKKQGGQQAEGFWAAACFYLIHIAVVHRKVTKFKNYISNYYYYLILYETMSSLRLMKHMSISAEMIIYFHFIIYCSIIK